MVHDSLGRMMSTGVGGTSRTRIRTVGLVMLVVVVVVMVVVVVVTAAGHHVTGPTLFLDVLISADDDDLVAVSTAHQHYVDDVLGHVDLAVGLAVGLVVVVVVATVPVEFFPRVAVVLCTISSASTTRATVARLLSLASRPNRAIIFLVNPVVIVVVLGVVVVNDDFLADLVVPRNSEELADPWTRKLLVGYLGSSADESRFESRAPRRVLAVVVVGASFICLLWLLHR